METPEPKVSVVVPAYNAAKTIGPLLHSLLKLDYPRYDVIVIDDGSRDRTPDEVRRYPVRLISQPNRGASAARDAGFRASTGDIVAYVDSDVTVTPLWLRLLVAPFSDASVGATTGRTVFLRNEKCTSWLRSLDIERRNSRRQTNTRLANGPNSAFRRGVLLEVGGFDPSWYHAEDTEVSYRISLRGYRIRYVPEAVVFHVPEDHWRLYLRKRYRDAKAFTRMLTRYTRPAILDDDFVSLGMKLQPPLFLAALALAIATALLLPTGVWPFLATALAATLSLATLANVPEAVAAARASGRVGFFFKGLALNILRGFVWGLGLGVGCVQQIAKG